MNKFTEKFNKNKEEIPGNVTSTYKVESKWDLKASMPCPTKNTPANASDITTTVKPLADSIQYLNDKKLEKTARAADSAKLNGKAEAALSVAHAGTSGSTTGNAGSATKLQNARQINGVAFDGTKNITISTNSHFEYKKTAEQITIHTKKVEYTAKQDFLLLPIMSGHSDWGTFLAIAIAGVDKEFRTYVGPSDSVFGAITVPIKNGQKYSMHEVSKGGGYNPGYSVYHYSIYGEQIKENGSKIVSVLTVDNEYAGVFDLKEREFEPSNYTEERSLPPKKGYARFFIEKSWDYKLDPLPNHRELCDWTEEGYVINKDKYKEFQRQSLSNEYLPKINALESACSKAFFLNNKEQLEQYKKVLTQLQEEFDNKLKLINNDETIEIKATLRILCPICESLLTVSEEGKEFCLKCGWKEGE